MSTHVEVRPGAYADSVALLQVSREVQQVAGVAAAQVAMATALNLEVLAKMGFDLPASTPNDMVVAIRLDDDAALGAALAAVETALTRRSRSTETATEPHRTTATALLDAPGAIVLVSTPGASAAVEAMDALAAGHDVMLFSDNVPVAHEVALKTYAAQHGLLVMGPDCGTAVVDGLGLGFANAVEPGPVGIVAASGTGCQQVLCLLDHAGVGVTHALGVGGRDLSAEIGGAATREALRRLDADPAVERIVVVSKPPAPEVAADLEQYAAGLGTPVSWALLGAGRLDLTAASEDLLAEKPTWPVDGQARPSAGPVRGYYVGGTLAAEARQILDEGAEVIDFGDDEYTRGRAHPMIDPTLRLERIAEVGDGVLLLDVVLGHGAEPDPAERLAPAVRAAVERGVAVVVACVGTRHDPQHRERQVAALVEVGAEVHLSHAGAARRALEVSRG
ncbi:FdrA family protein [Nocardioides mangrovicus]|uniref:FdrA family protein n=1 Tax=Nocardioides mangrovicus TaxID=2478913 RepID=A0A3L8P618_9ACTN|nr:FdrA family protein [Nocardioides mangrovicus]RLV50866.1 FdrA family protein [Nocardioides mangrovicus]